MDPTLASSLFLALPFLPVVFIAVHAVWRGRSWFLWSLLALALPVLGLVDSFSGPIPGSVRRAAFDLRYDPITLWYPYVTLVAYLVTGALINRRRWELGDAGVPQLPSLTAWQTKRRSARTYVGDTLGVALTGSGIVGAIYFLVGPLGGWVYPVVGGIAVFALLCALVGGIRVAYLASHSPADTTLASDRPSQPPFIMPQVRTRPETQELLVWEAKRQAARQQAMRSLGVAIIGLLILGGTYAFAVSQGGVYLIPWGAILFGLLVAIGGFLRFVWYSMRRPRPSSVPAVRPAPIRVADAAPAALFPDRLKTCPRCGTSARYWTKQCPTCHSTFPLPHRGEWPASPQDQLPDEQTVGNAHAAVAERIRMLRVLHDEGHLTDEEFQETKMKLLSRL